MRLDKEKAEFAAHRQEAQKEEIRKRYSKISKGIFTGSAIGVISGVIGLCFGMGFWLFGPPPIIEQTNPYRRNPIVIQYNETLQDRRDVENSIAQLTTRRNSLVPELPYQIEEVQPLLEYAFSDSPRQVALDSLINRYGHAKDSIVGELDNLKRNNSEIKAYTKWDNAIKEDSSLGLMAGGLLLYVISLFGGESLRRKFREKERKKISELEAQATTF